jgi:hypothetical protein
MDRIRTKIYLYLIATATTLLISGCAGAALSEEELRQTAEVLFAIETGEAAPTVFALQTLSVEQTANAPTLTSTFTPTFTLTPTFTTSPTSTFTLTPTITLTPTKSLGCFLYLDADCIGNDQCAQWTFRNPGTLPYSFTLTSLDTGGQTGATVPPNDYCTVFLHQNSKARYTWTCNGVAKLSIQVGIGKYRNSKLGCNE